MLAELSAALRAGTRAVLAAPPGAGKTTIVPLSLLDAPWRGDGRILVLEPRRLAAKSAARRMAALLSQSVGETVGYRVRLDSKIGPRTRIEVITDGILIRMLQDDPGLDGVAAVIFDEVHERGLEADLGLALALDAQTGLRDDLRLVMMSATLDTSRLAGLLAAPVIESQGRAHPVATHHAPLGIADLKRHPADIAHAAAKAVRHALETEAGSVLVFLPGVGEIRRTADHLSRVDAGTEVMPLYGDLPPAAQDAAIAPPAPGRRKVVLATSIAETSLTIEGVRVVIDTGFRRAPVADPGRGLTGLETVRISRAAADQRRGRAGRTEPGVCFRLWLKGAEGGLAPFDRPEILDADLAGLALALALWGCRDPDDLVWQDPPPAQAFQAARDLLGQLGAVDAGGRITDHGRAMAGLPAHPRLAHMLLAAKGLGAGAVACDLAALLGERDPLTGAGPDLRLRLDPLRRGDGRFAPIREAAAQLRRRIGVKPGAAALSPGAVLSFAYPDRIARRRQTGSARLILSGGQGAGLGQPDPLPDWEYFVVAGLDAGGARRSDAGVRLICPIERAEILDRHGDRVAWRRTVRFDAERERFLGRDIRGLGAMPLEERGFVPGPEELLPALIALVRERGLHLLGWTDAAKGLRARVAFARSHGLAGLGWPDWSDGALLDGLEDWLAPFLAGVTGLKDLAGLDVAPALATALGAGLGRDLDRLAPALVAVPSGRDIPVDYDRAQDSEGPILPVLPVRLQEMFGATETPALGDSGVPLTLHLLSPAGRPVQVTRDLAGFWRGSYKAVRAELRGRYPKHPWPDDPLAAPATAKTKRHR